MCPDALRNAVVVGHDFTFQRVSGNLVENGIFTAGTQLVEIVISLADNRFPNEKLRRNQVAEIIRTGVVGTPACGNIAGISVLHDSSNEEFDRVRSNGIVKVVGIVIPEIFVFLGQGIAGLLRNAGFNAVTGLTFVAADGAGNGVAVGGG